MLVVDWILFFFFFPSGVAKKYVDVELGHIAARASSLEVAHNLDCNKTATNREVG
jgi:hypothetical protein